MTLRTCTILSLAAPALLISGCWPATIEKTNLATEAKTFPIQASLQLSANNSFTITVTNASARTITFSPRADFMAVYHKAPDGSRTAMTWDGSNADMKPLRSSEVVMLAPKAKRVFRKAALVDVQHGIDTTRNLSSKGSLYAVLRPVHVGDFEEQAQKEVAEWNLLAEEVRSAEIQTPIAPKDAPIEAINYNVLDRLVEMEPSELSRLVIENLDSAEEKKAFILNTGGNYTWDHYSNGAVWEAIFGTKRTGQHRERLIAFVDLSLAIVAAMEDTSDLKHEDRRCGLFALGLALVRCKTYLAAGASKDSEQLLAILNSFTFILPMVTESKGFDERLALLRKGFGEFRDIANASEPSDLAAHSLFLPSHPAPYWDMDRPEATVTVPTFATLGNQNFIAVEGKTGVSVYSGEFIDPGTSANMIKEDAREKGPSSLIGGWTVWRSESTEDRRGVISMTCYKKDYMLVLSGNIVPNEGSLRSKVEEVLQAVLLTWTPVSRAATKFSGAEEYRKLRVALLDGQVEDLRRIYLGQFENNGRKLDPKQRQAHLTNLHNNAKSLSTLEIDPTSCTQSGATVRCERKEEWTSKTRRNPNGPVSGGYGTIEDTWLWKDTAWRLAKTKTLRVMTRD